jgi:hypothetical protein
VLQQPTRILHGLSGDIRIEVHDVVRIHEADGQRPRLAVVIQGTPLGAHPGDGAPRDHVVEVIAPELVAHDVTGRVVVREAVHLHLLVEELIGLAVEAALALVAARWAPFTAKTRPSRVCDTDAARTSEVERMHLNGRHSMGAAN